MSQQNKKLTKRVIELSPYSDIPNEANVKDLVDFIEQEIAEAIDSLPKIQDGEYYFVSGKDIDKAVQTLRTKAPSPTEEERT